MASSIGWKKLTAAQSRAMGLKPSSKRYVRANVVNFRPGLETISERQAENLKNAKRVGKPVSRERLTAMLAKGEVEFRSEKAAKLSPLQKRLAVWRRAIPGLTPADSRLLDRKYRGSKTSFQRWSKADVNAFRAIFTRYNRDAVLEALGSPVVDGDVPDDDDPGDWDIPEEYEAA